MEVAEFLAALRRAFGDATIDQAVARGRAGEPTFLASENGQTVGTQAADTAYCRQVDDSVWDRHFCRGAVGNKSGPK